MNEQITLFVAYTAILVFIILVIMWGLEWIYGEEIKEKQATMRVHPDELVYCYYGNPNKETVICDKIDRKIDMLITERRTHIFNAF